MTGPETLSKSIDLSGRDAAAITSMASGIQSGIDAYRKLYQQAARDQIDYDKRAEDLVSSLSHFASQLVGARVSLVNVVVPKHTQEMEGAAYQQEEAVSGVIRSAGLYGESVVMVTLVGDGGQITTAYIENWSSLEAIDWPETTELPQSS